MKHPTSNGADAESDKFSGIANQCRPPRQGQVEEKHLLYAKHSSRHSGVGAAKTTPT